MTGVFTEFPAAKKLYVRRSCLWSLIVGAFCLRLWLSFQSNDIIDVQNFRLVAQTIQSQGIFALYAQTPGQYPYPPLWIWFAWAAEQLTQLGILDFSLLIRLPSIVADTLCVYFVWAWWNDRHPCYSWLSAFLYAINPISLVVTSLHGQFDSLPTLLIIIALYTFRRGQVNLSASALSFAIAAKSFPVLLLPVLLISVPSLGARIRYILIALTPVVMILLPFMFRIPSAVIDQLFGYAGVGLLGFLVIIRSIYVSIIGEHLPYELTQVLISISKWIFLAAYGSWILLTVKRRISLTTSAAGIFCLFYLIYGGISPQYLIWIVPLLLCLPARSLFWSIAYALSGTVALLGFYSYAVPAAIQPIFTSDFIDARWLYGGGGILWWATIGVLLVWLVKRIAFSPSYILDQSS
jgi:Gpi18-like mannosyltransferase